MPLSPTEQAITNDIASMIVTQAPLTFLGRGVPSTSAKSTAPPAVISGNVVTITFADGRIFAIAIDVKQLNTNAGRV